LPEKHGCEEVTREKLSSKGFFEKSLQRSGSFKPDQTDYKKAYEIPGVMEVIKGKANWSETESEKTQFDVDEKLIAATILLLIFFIGVISRVL
jgi:hypothetical protein